MLWKEKERSRIKVVQMHNLRGLLGIRRRELKVNAGKINVMVMNGEEVLECDVHLEGLRLEHVSKFKYLECILDEVGTDGKNVVGRCSPVVQRMENDRITKRVYVGDGLKL